MYKSVYKVGNPATWAYVITYTIYINLLLHIDNNIEGIVIMAM